MVGREINHLIQLLDDPDYAVYSTVVARLLELGHVVVPYLEKAWEQSDSPQLQLRIEYIVQQMQSGLAASGLQEWIEGRYHNLLEGTYWVAKQAYPNLSIQPLQEKVDSIVKDVWVSLEDDSSPIDKINVLNYFFYSVYGFNSAPTDDFLNPDYGYIHRVIESKRGNPVSLGLLYMYIAQQAGLPIQGVCLPRNFLLAYTHVSDDVLFYINPFHAGSILQRDDIEFYFRTMQITPRPEFYKPCPACAVVRRLVEVQIFAYEHEGIGDKADIFRGLLPLFGAMKTAFMEE